MMKKIQKIQTIQMIRAIQATQAIRAIQTIRTIREGLIIQVTLMQDIQYQVQHGMMQMVMEKDKVVKV